MDEERDEIEDEERFERHPHPVMTDKEKEQLISWEKNVIAGGIAGSLGKTATAPLSRLTVLYQVGPLLNQGKSNIKMEDSLLKSIQNIVKREGFFSLWKGNFTAVFHRFPFSAFNFAIFEALKAEISEEYRDLTVTRVACGASAGAISCFLCYPLELVRTQLTVGTAGNGKTGNKILRTMIDIYQRDGTKGLYRGLTASLLVAIPNYAISFSVYGRTKEYLLKSRSSIFVNDNGRLTPIGSLVSGSMSGLTSSLTLFPLDVIRKRMQVMGSIPSNRAAPAITQPSVQSIVSSQQIILATSAPSSQITGSNFSSPRLPGGPTPRGLVDHARGIAQKDGVRGFYRGIMPELLKVCPMVAVTFCTYETTKDLLDDYWPR